MFIVSVELLSSEEQQQENHEAHLPGKKYTKIRNKI